MKTSSFLYICFVLGHVHVNNIPPEGIQAHAEKVCHIDLLKVRQEELQNIKVWQDPRSTVKGPYQRNPMVSIHFQSFV